MRGWIPALRIARREARRSRGRSILVLAMIALPVAALSFTAVTYDMFTLTKPEEVTRRLGTADAEISWVSQTPIQQAPAGFNWTADDRPVMPGNTKEQVLAHLPPGSRAVSEAKLDVSARTGPGVAQMSGCVTDLADPIQHGRADLVAGQAPRRPGEIALSRAAAEHLRANVNDSVRLLDPAGTFTVTGIVEYADQLGEIVVFSPDNTVRENETWYVTTPGGLDWTEVQRLNAIGMHVYSRTVNLDPQLGSDFGALEGVRVEQLALPMIIGGLAVLEIVLLCGPAFAVGARRRARDLALIAAAGGQPKQLRRIVLADGVVLGVGGAIAGLVVGVGLAAGARPLIETYIAHTRAGGWRFFPLALLGISGFAVATGLLAAMVPAWTAARQDVVLVLSGRRGIVRSRRRWIAAGLALAGFGILIAAAGATSSTEDAILFGLILLELGLVLVTPALIGFISRAGRWLPLAPRLALRSAARNRSSAAPAISAVMAAVAGAVAVGVFSAGSDQQAYDGYQAGLPMGYVGVQTYLRPLAAEPDWAQALAAVREVLPTATPRLIRVPEPTPFIPPPQEIGYLNAYGGPFFWSIVDDGSSLPALTNADPADIASATAMLAAGGVVVTDPHLVSDGHVTLDVEGRQVLKSPAYALTTGVPGVGIVLSQAAADQAGLTVVTRGLVAQTTTMPSLAEQERLNLLLGELTPNVNVKIERGPEFPSNPFELILALAAAVIALGAAGIATGLAAADSRADLATLAAVGANPGLRRRLSLSQAGLISGIGAALGTLTGLGTAAALIVATNALSGSSGPPVPFIIPWTAMAIVIAAPLLAMAGAGLFTRAGLPIERRF